MAQANSVQREPSMEEILASIRRIIEDSDTARKHVDGSEPPSAPADAEPGLEAAIELEAFREELRPETPARPASLAEIQAEAARAPRPESFAEASWPHAAEPDRLSTADEEELDPASDETMEQSVQAENQNPRPAILSEHAGRQVAASFDELSEAFAASRRKDFDQMAEEMLRPMLQDWLDNNLPLLVERLVREEIERVARGGAR